MIVVITGSRGWTDRDVIRLAIDALPSRSKVVTGGAWGADLLAEEYARVRGHQVVTVRPNYAEFGKGAPLKRNDQMLDMLADVDDADRRVIAFWLGFSRGTRYTIREAMRRGLPLDLYWRPELEAN
jgi:hypothetical protein